MGKFLTLALLSLLLACQSESPKPLPEAIRQMELITPRGEAIKTRLVFTDQDQIQGLSGVKPENFTDTEGMLFWYVEEGMKHFWMPDTYFDLDLFYLDKDLKITDIIRKLPHYIGRHNEQLIPRARGVWARHVLEMKSGSPIGTKLQIGEKLEWKGRYNLEETDRRIKNYLGGKEEVDF